MENNEREILKKKREKWLSERNLEKKMNDLGITQSSLSSESTNRNILNEITLKISEKFQKELSKQANNDKTSNIVNHNLEKTIYKEIESNTCGICYELMVPPKYSPMLLFPCGHSFCKNCIYQSNNEPIKKCPFCRTFIKSIALNISLQKLICIFTNNKHLLEKYELESEKEKEIIIEKENNKDIGIFKNNMNICNIRYNILNDELHEINKQESIISHDINNQKKLIDNFYIEKKKVEEQIEKLKKELELIKNYYESSEKELFLLEEKDKENKIKKNLIEQTLQSIKIEKEKFEIIISQMQINK